MSTDSVEAETAAVICCASCGTAQVDDVKLKKCDACDLVHYCSDNCKQEHLPHHKARCKERAAELRDEILFKQPESSHLGDCPICCLPLPIDNAGKSALMPCCSKIVCNGCYYASKLHRHRENLQETCPFCRHPIPKNDEEAHKKLMKRIAANDPVAITQRGLNLMKRVEANDPIAMWQIGGLHQIKEDYVRAFEYWSNAAQLGNADAHYNLSIMYEKGKGVEKDEMKEIYHLEEAAIAGHPQSRFALGSNEWENERDGRAVKHWIIAANQGYDDSIKALMVAYKGGFVSKENLAAALRAQKAAVDETKSPQREAAAKAFHNY
uniref:MYND-type domain-containing protein n=1 Tax=Skeletonema marinoi TaxID=267567 RepID=A0A7S2LVZ9_9STRA|mmetsp:Transcript_30790/g.52289  ORF Transcript_30790/g.52289 Transcript_30790/m.52289 type:complete len:323 (+) Transcript_30790:37-1005(+)